MRNVKTDPIVELFSNPMNVKRCFCPVCRKLLAKRTIVHNENGEAGIVYIKHRGLQIIGFVLVVICPSCVTRCRIDGSLGITEVIKNEYYTKLPRRKRGKPEPDAPGTVEDTGQEDKDVRPIPKQGEHRPDG